MRRSSRGVAGASAQQALERGDRRTRRAQQAVALVVEHHEAELALELVPLQAGLIAFTRARAFTPTLTGRRALARRRAADHRLVERLLQREPRRRRHPGRDHAGEQARLLGEFGVEQLLDLVARVAVADQRDRAQAQREQAEHQRQGAAADRAHQALSTR